MPRNLDHPHHLPENPSAASARTRAARDGEGKHENGADAASIFVSIASYRDPDCKNTIRDLLAKARHPARVLIGVCLQLVPDEDIDCTLPPEHARQMRVLQVHASQSEGACWARSQVQSLFQDEDYYLQIDSHMRFVPGWDQRLIAMLAQCEAATGTGKALLSSYPLSFTPPDIFADEGIVTIEPKAFSAEGILAQRSTLTAIDHAPAQPQPVYLLGAGLIFARGTLVREVPYDPYLYFEGEEISLAVRCWTHGWDLFAPNQAVAWHDYGKRPERARHWKDQTDWTAYNARSLARIAHLLHITPCTESDYLHGIERYGLGAARSLDEYEQASKIDFAAHSYRGQPLPAEELAAGHESQCQLRRDMFAAIWVNNAWRCAETRSGNGSSMLETVGLRQWLPGVLEALDCKVLADMGCGDLNWIRDMLSQLRFYFAYDIVPGLIGDLRTRFHDRSNCFFTEWDMVLQTPPQCDVILCRDSLTHLPLDAALLALQHFRRSGSRYLIATTHQHSRNRWIGSGAWHAVNLCAPPFNLPEPLFVLNEGGSKMLGVWACTDLPAAAQT